MSLSPLPWSSPAINQCSPCSWARIARASSVVSTTGSRFDDLARTTLSIHGGLTCSTCLYRNKNADSACD